jgi:hypothetical protein
MANSNTLEIIQGLSQAAANAYDGVHDERFSLDGQARKVKQDPDAGGSENRTVDQAIRDFLELNSNKRPKNDTRKG